MKRYHIFLAVLILVVSVSIFAVIAVFGIPNKKPPQAPDCYAAGPCAFEQAGATCEYLGKSYTCKACVWLATDAVNKYPDGSIFTNPSCKPSN